MTLAGWIAAGSRIEVAGSQAASWSSAELARRVEAYAGAMTRGVGTRAVIGLLAGNSPQWIAIDLAAQAAGMTLVPLPAFFTRQQMAHAARASDMQAIICADATQAASLGFVDEVCDVDGLRLFRCRSGWARERAAHEARKITFTSGTTGEPKGVTLSIAQQLATACDLATATAKLGITRHLCALPLPVLLENVAGVYTALATGAACICPRLEDIGVAGASGFDPERFLDAVAHYRPESFILLPQMLQALVARLAGKGSPDPRIASLRFVPVGGARTPKSLILRARDLGLPVYEGYGLTECASVVSVNLPGADRAGTVGRPLPGVSVRIAADGEIEIAGRSGNSRGGAAAGDHEPWLKSGDLGAIDADGYLSVTGRKKNVLITSFGRNVSPEWPEGLLLESPLLAQAAVFGDACPALAAILVPSSPQVDDGSLDALVSAVNARLPDYARICNWIRASDPFSARNGLATANGRLRRDAVALRYASQLTAIYERTKICS